MKTDITTLYKQMTPKELANLAVNAIIRNDKKDFELINNSVKRKDYNCPDIEYQSRRDGIVQLGLFYGVEWWKNQALNTAALWANEINPDTLIIDALNCDVVMEFQTRLASLELALNQVCEQIQIDINTVKWWAGIEEGMSKVFMPILPHHHNEKWLNYYLELLSNAARG